MYRYAAAEDLRAQVTATQKLLGESNARVATLEGQGSDADNLVAELRRQLDASAAALDAAGAEKAIAVEKAAEDKAAALKAAEEEATARADTAAEAAKAAAEGVAAAVEAAEAAEAASGALANEWSTRADAAAALAADELATVKAAAAADVALRDGSIAGLEAVAAERAGRIAALEQEAETLNTEIRVARADLATQREAAAAEAARLDAAHAAALTALDTRRREEVAAGERRLEESEVKHVEVVEALEMRSNMTGKRLSWAFSASRALLDDANAALKRDHHELRARFDARESRGDDLQKIAGLKQDVRKLEGQCVGLQQETQQLTLKLQNRNVNDAVFGGSGMGGANKRAAGGGKQLSPTAGGGGGFGSGGPTLRPKSISTAPGGAPAKNGARDAMGSLALKPMRDAAGGFGGAAAPAPSSFGNANFSRLGNTYGMR